MALDWQRPQCPHSNPTHSGLKNGLGLICSRGHADAVLTQPQTVKLSTYGRCSQRLQKGVIKQELQIRAPWHALLERW